VAEEEEEKLGVRRFQNFTIRQSDADVIQADPFFIVGFGAGFGSQTKFRRHLYR
jgi:hypothetical protein